MQDKSGFEYYKSCIKDNYANFEGRARRAEYWNYVLFNTLIILGLLAFAGIGAGLESTVLMSIGGLLYIVYAFGVLIPGLAVAIRRLHDTDKSGWMLLIYLIPLVGSIILLVFLVSEGTHGENTYGPDPKGYDEFA